MFSCMALTTLLSKTGSFAAGTVGLPPKLGAAEGPEGAAAAAAAEGEDAAMTILLGGATL